ncbi:hypothetical protein [Lolliginicoccus suaedae]|uniref:hypothetical protein n=1 Tax=Lolliginicoccus suaedae TaxID=2605429 RepID=UPI0011ED8F31|nr:hypothetical protein [Lolliginicoccus suaedae]
MTVTILPAPVAAFPPLALAIRLLDDIHVFAEVLRKVLPQLDDLLAMGRDLATNLEKALPMLEELNGNMGGAIPHVGSLNGHLDTVVPLMALLDVRAGLSGLSSLTPIDGAFDRLGRVVDRIPGARMVDRLPGWRKDAAATA